MSIGQLRERCTIEQETSTADGMGGQVLAWQELLICWARVTPKTGGENVDGDQVTAHVHYEIVIRYRDDVTAGMRVLWRGRVFNIRSIINRDEHYRYSILICEEGAAV